MSLNFMDSASQNFSWVDGPVVYLNQLIEDFEEYSIVY